MGRPEKLNIDYVIAKKLVEAGLTQIEIAKLHKVHRHTLQKDKKFMDIWEKSKQKKKIDCNVIKGLARKMCKINVIADMLVVNVERLKKDKKIMEAFKQGRAFGMTDISDAQNAAAKSGNPAMLIWLGKQHLGQSDNQGIKHSGAISLTSLFDTIENNRTDGTDKKKNK